MLRVPLSRSRHLTAGAIARRSGSQWLAAQRVGAAGFGQRHFADQKKPDETVLPGSESVHAPRAAAPSTSPAQPIINPNDVPLTPPAPGTSGSGTGVPTGTGTASTAPPSLPPKKGRFRRFLTTLLLLTALGYGGGVYYALVSDNFHDFFTEYVPFGEDAVGYFEERQFRKRFAEGTAGSNRLHQQVRGENKVTIPSKSGLSWKVAGEEEEKQKSGRASDLSHKGKHASAVEETAKESEKKAAPSKAKKEEKKEGTPVAAPAVTPIDKVELKQAAEPVVQDVVKIVNDIITVIGSDNTGGKYNSAIEKAKAQLTKVIGEIETLKAASEKQAQDKIRNLHTEFDNGAKELVKRIEAEMHEQEARWKEEFEAEREKLSQSYQTRLNAELQAAKELYEQQRKNELLEQSIALQRQFATSVREHVEKEREGRLAKLGELSNSVAELERLTAEWNSVIDTNLRTQHMLVAVEAARAAVEKTDRPRPFVEELAAIKEVASDDPVVNAVIASINPSAYQKGVPTPSQLVDRFRRVAAEVRKAALLPEDAGVASHAASLVLSKVMFKKGPDGQGLPVGDDVESVLTRTEMLLEEGNIDAAAREMNGLNGWAKVLARDWLGDARRVLEVRQALDVLSTEARLQSLLVE
ncbi:mitochondrial inner membrane protein Mitofilin [Phyllosticta citribraziliensis]|uniref:MICOS complex subunit MIC60 n=1 Tax=Phyllosticta citribraziliensis TaxID=989973 RepID=A0ABR1M976_9PEZI